MTDTRRHFIRSSDIEDLTVRSDGTGRTVEAFAVAYGSPTRIDDAEGRYTEVIMPGAAKRSLEVRGTNIEVLWNHGRSIDGRATSAADAIPIGVPVEVTDTERGVYTVTEYLDHPVANAVLAAIKKRAIRGQSFTGTFLETRRTRSIERGGLPLFERVKLDLREYGPVLRPSYAAAEIVGTRSSLDDWLLEWAAADDDARRAELLGFTLPPLTKASVELEFSAGGDMQDPGQPDPAAPPDVVMASQAPRHSGRHDYQRLRRHARQIGALR